MRLVAEPESEFWFVTGLKLEDPVRLLVGADPCWDKPPPGANEPPPDFDEGVEAPGNEVDPLVPGDKKAVEEPGFPGPPDFGVGSACAAESPVDSPLAGSVVESTGEASAVFSPGSADPPSECITAKAPRQINNPTAPSRINSALEILGFVRGVLVMT